MMFDHLRIVDEGTTQIIETLIQGQVFSTEVRIQDVKPNVNAGPEVYDAFIKAVANYEAAIRQFGSLGRYLSHPHPSLAIIGAR
jgi:hypothetical protein